MPRPWSADRPATGRPATDRPESESTSLRLQRVLAMAGVGSRRHCEEYILTGRVTVDGETVTELGSKVDPNTQEVRLDGERVKLERAVYYVLNKPKGYLCTNLDPGGRPRAVDLLPSKRERLFTVGRLDENSTGLLLCTNDGELANRLAHPRFRVPKIYSVQVAGVPTREAVTQLQEGMYFADGRFKADDVQLVKVQGKSAFLQIELTEGQNREIRRLLARIGHKVLSLERVSLGPLKLGSVPVGSYRILAPDEIRRLQEFSWGRGREPSGRAGKKGKNKFGTSERGARKVGGAPRREGSGDKARPPGKAAAGGKRFAGSKRPGGAKRPGKSFGKRSGPRSSKRS